MGIPGHLVDPHPDRFDWSRLDHKQVLEAHRAAVAAGEGRYIDPSSGFIVLSAEFLWQRGACCDSGCRHCPYLGDRQPPPLP